jgi:hypothetical protein
MPLHPVGRYVKGVRRVIRKRSIMDARMMDFEHWKQRHKEILREVERNLLAKAESGTLPLRTVRAPH